MKCLPAKKRPHRRGFMIMLVLTVFIFLGGAIIAMTALFAHEARRARAAGAQVQLRQLLLAAVPAAQAELKAGPAPRDVALPVPVEGASVMLHLEGQVVHVHATYRGTQASQTLTFDGGKLASAALDQTGGF